ncbi:MAG TPA: hypothetical protein VFT06_11055 [Flavisolibacter sp.]|nr:hypothetical protein [Flavisolibacter sp.]
MKNKFFYLTVLLVSAITISSCASRKYGCPNSTGLKMQTTTTVHTAV